jgi:hypothetical protein
MPTQPRGLRDHQSAAKAFLQTATVMTPEMGHGARRAQAVELGERVARESFALYSMFPGSQKRELLLAGLPQKSRVVVICPKAMERVWKETTWDRRIGCSVRTWGREYAAMNAKKVGLDVATHCDYLIVEEPRGPKQCKRLAQIAIKAPRVVIVGFTVPESMIKNLRDAATVLGVPPKAMSTVLMHGGPTTPGGAL